MTRDVDVTLLTGLGQEEHFIQEWLKEFSFRPPCNSEFALRNRVLLLVNRRQISLDIALGAFDFEVHSVERSSIWQAGGQYPLRTCSAEDLIVHKCFANRDRDWVDVDGILARQWGKLDLKLARAELKPLVDLKEEPEIMSRFEKLILRHSQPFKVLKPSQAKPPS